MKTLTMNESQLVSGGCPQCLALPGVCIAGSVIATGASFLGWGKLVGYTVAAALASGGAYLLYQKFEEKGLDILS